MTDYLKRRKYEEDCGSMSDSCVYTARSKDFWASGFPPGITVDELKHYCRKKIADHPKDNLHLLEGSFKGLLSEYQRCFKNFHILGGSVDGVNKENISQYEYRGKRKVPESLISLEGPLDLNSEYKVSYVNYFNLGKVKRENTMENGDKTHNSETPPDFRSQLENHRHASHWRFLKKNTNLQLEGEHFLQTEKADKFIQFPFQRRPELAKRSTTLKLEGDMEKKTEMRDKFSPIQLQERPPLYKKDTNLHLEGDLLLLTENREKYVPTVLQSRPKLTKKNTNLKLDGDLELMPEYKQFFVEHKCKPSEKIVPVNNLKTEGDYDMKTEHASRFTQHQLIHPIIPHLRESEPGRKFHLGDDDTVRKPEYKAKYVMYDKPERRTASIPKSNLTQEGEIDTKTENKVQFVVKTIPKRERQRSTGNISLEGDIDMNPEYKNAYVDFYASSAKSLPLPERRKPPQSHLNEDIKMENGINLKPEYRSSYVDFPRQRPSVKKPETHLSLEGNLLLQTEKRDKYVPYLNVPRVVPIRRMPELSLEGPFECQPEYRKAYQAYLIRENLERKHRPFDNLSALQAAEKTSAGLV
ncbi:uncharacterized protein LOC108734213 isoform X2 [Agrilus planipennis]|uniref:Uncharacterized protein LOC108734213 isoform X2 n=1 Tax=Agrilus planipennis TaxID=224129 RepID=A0A7F5RLR3_AGRPL|nr:uncharacterized protein LOC108734213 isoform X2 [Agrilus planipennis]